MLSRLASKLKLSKLQTIVLVVWCVFLLVPTRMMLKDQLDLPAEHTLLVTLNTLSELPHISHRWGMFERLPEVFRIPSYQDDSGKEVIATDFVKTPSIGYKRSRINLMSTLALNYIRQMCYEKPADEIMNLTIYAKAETDVEVSDWEYYPYKTFISNVCQDPVN